MTTQTTKPKHNNNNNDGAAALTTFTTVKYNQANINLTKSEEDRKKSMNSKRSERNKSKGEDESNNGKLGQTFFKAYGVETATASNTKRSLNERSPTEEGTKKKQSLFGINTSFTNNSGKKSKDNEIKKTPNWQEVTKTASDLFLNLVITGNVLHTRLF